MPYKDKEVDLKYHSDYGKRYRKEHPDYSQRYRSKHPEEFRCVVYVWIAPDGVADYVGRGSMQRAKSHKYKTKNPYKFQSQSWWTPNHFMLSMTCENEWQAMEMEGKWGQFYQPRYNREGYRYTDYSQDNLGVK